VAQSSSAKKVAKLASRGKGKKIRFAGGTMFPVVITAIVVASLALVVYARQSRPGDGSGSPAVGEHWHAAFAIRVCDTWESKIRGLAEETELDPTTGEQRYANRDFAATGIHSHNDGVMHWHANSLRATGNRAKLGVFLDVYDIEVDDDSLTLPPEQGGGSFSESDLKCGGQDTEMRMRVWDNFSNPSNYRDVVTGFRDVLLKQDGMVFVIAFVPEGAEIPFPPYACGLREIGASDGGSVITTTTFGGSATTSGDVVTPTTAPTGLDSFECVDPSQVSTTVAPSTTVGATSTISATTSTPGTTTPDTTTPDTTTPDTTTPDTTTPDTTG
jgi:hypothetical protein